MPKIHPSAVIEPGCVIADDAEVGPGCVLSAGTTLGKGARLLAHVCTNGRVTIGDGTIAYPFASLGFEPQDFKFKPGMKSAGVVIGAGCVIRESVTIHAATKEDAPTTIGDRVYMMASSHAGHDVAVGNDVILVNSAMLGGHSRVFDRATIGAACGVHQFTRVGRLAFMSGGTGVSMDVPPFCVVAERQRTAGINRVGMRRAGIARDEITAVDEAYREVFRVGSISRDEMVKRLEAIGGQSPALAEIVQFVRESKRGICPGPGRPPRLFTTWLHAARRGVAAAASVEDEEQTL